VTGPGDHPGPDFLRFLLVLVANKLEKFQQKERLMTVKTHREFLEALFGGRVNVDDLHVCSFRGAENGGPWTGRWMGGRLAGRESLSPRRDGFFCIAELRDPKGSRSVGNVGAQHLIIADDVRTKADPQKLLDLFGPPTAATETSPGNESWYWRLSIPVPGSSVDRARALAAIREYMKVHGLTDPGSADAVRYVRLPWCPNTKEKNWNPMTGTYFETRLVQWNPNNVVNLELACLGAFGPDWRAVIAAGNYPVVGAGGLGAGSGAWSADMGDVWVRLGEEIGMQPRRGSGSGKIDANCPNMAAHLERHETGFAFLGHGVMKCQHGPCAGLTSGDFRAMMVEEYDRQHAGGIALGVEVDAVTRMAQWTFEGAGVDGLSDGSGAGTLLEEADGVAARLEAADRDMRLERQGAVDRLVRELVWVGPISMFFHVDRRELYAPETFDRLDFVRRVIPVGRSGDKKASNVVLNHPDMKDAEGVVFEVGDVSPLVTTVNEAGRSVVCVNMARPSGVGRRRGLPRAWLKLFRFVIQNRAARRYFLRYMAHMIQKPGERSSIVPFIIGGQGIGKSTLLDPVVTILGQHNCSKVTQAMLDGQFNGWQTSRLAILEEIHVDRRTYARLKDMSSAAAPWVTINEKFQKPYKMKSRVMLFGLTNSPDALEGYELNDRRFMIYYSPAEIPADHATLGADVPGSEAWFQSVMGVLGTREEIERVHEFLMTLDISRWNPHARAPNLDDGQNTMAAMTATESENWVRNQLGAGGLFADRAFLNVNEVRDAAVATGDRLLALLTTRTIGKEFTLAGLKPVGPAETPDGKQPRVWQGPAFKDWLASDPTHKHILKSQSRAALGKKYAEEKENWEKNRLKSQFGDGADALKNSGK
jgi:hypothetical protein